MTVSPRKVVMAASQSFSSRTEIVGLAFVASVGLMSAVSTLGLLSYIAWNASVAGERGSFVRRGLRSFTFSSLGCYLISLLICDFLQGAAFALNYRWAILGSMSEGTVCTIQGAVSQVGDLGAAIWSMAISVHTFWHVIALLFLLKQPHRLAVPLVMVAGWALLIFLPIIGPKAIQKSHRGAFYGLTGAWCWIGNGYNPERVLFLYAWVFVALGSSFITYTLIFLRFTNLIAVGESGFLRFQLFRSRASVRDTLPTTTRCYTLSFGPRQSTSAPRDVLVDLSGTLEYNHMDLAAKQHSHLKRIARRIMWYPLVYGVVVLPISICRMGVLAGQESAFGIFIFAGVCFASSGITNTILFITTRRSFITQQSNILATSVHVSTQVTQHIIVREDPNLNHSMDERKIEMIDPFKFSDPKGNHAIPKSCIMEHLNSGMKGDVMLIE